MVARKGYKLTEVGEIPEDWEIVPLGSIATFRTGPFGSALHKTDYVFNGVPVINPMQIVDGKIRPTLSMAVSIDTLQRLSEFILEKGDIVLGRRGEMGRCAVVDDISAGWLCGTGSLIIRTQDVNNYFLFRILSSKRVINDLETSSIGTTMTNLNQDILGNLQIQHPPTLKEQTAIATALSDADTLIEALEQRITKKRHIKQGAMQELLTGKKRLPGFEGEWEEKELSALCSMKSGSTITESKISTIHAYPCIGGNGLRGYTFTFTHDGHYVLIGRQGALCGNIVEIEGKFFASEHALVVTVKSHVAPSYLAHAFKYRNLNQYSESSAQPGLSAQKMLSLIFLWPPTLDEQTAIAAVLSDMDDEIAALEAKLTKARQIKAGMMQELLTGRIRLI